MPATHLAALVHRGNAKHIDARAGSHAVRQVAVHRQQCVPRHLARGHHFRCFLKLQRLLINVSAAVRHNDIRIQGTLFTAITLLTLRAARHGRELAASTAAVGEGGAAPHLSQVRGSATCPNAGDTAIVLVLPQPLQLMVI